MNQATFILEEDGQAVERRPLSLDCWNQVEPKKSQLSPD